MSSASEDRPVEVMTFGQLSIAFDDSVLRPREWTTLQSRWAAELLVDAPAGPVLEVCSGAGHIGLLAVAMQPRDLVQVDLSPRACELARTNAMFAGLRTRVDVRCGPMDEVIDDSERFAVIIADPPWVPSADTSRFPDDPLVAIDGGDDGLFLVQMCLDIIALHLDEGGFAVLQIGTVAQMAAVESHLAGHPHLGLRVGGSRAHQDRGVLLLIDRGPDDAVSAARA